MTQKGRARVGSCACPDWNLNQNGSTEAGRLTARLPRDCRYRVLIEYTRSPSRLNERTLSFSFFFNCPLIRPRTLCVCQPVARISSFSVAPFGRSSSAITRAVLPLAPARLCATRGGFLPELGFLTDRGRFGA